MKLHFHGGARIVTGTNYLLEVGNTKILIDCGMFQGAQHVEDKNYEDFPFNPEEIDFLLVTHAHIDHTGRIPKLYKDGFQGKILATRPTKDFAKNMLEDSQGILEYEAKKLKRKPLYKKIDVEKSLKLIEGVNYGKKIDLDKGISCRFRDAGHILGSAIIEVWAEGKKIVFSGDLGNPPVPLLKPTEFIKEADYVVIESTYGDRIHEVGKQRKDLLENAIEDTIAKRGVLMIPALALERTQELLYELNELVENHRIPKVPIFIDSPLAIRDLEVYRKYPEYYNKEAAYLIKSGDDLFKFPGLVLTKTVEESKRINDIKPPKIIIAGSGMSTGGRILHHEIRYLPNPNNTILFISFQIAGCLGRRIFDRVKEVKIFNEIIPVRAEVRAIGGYSAHADQETLRNWIDKVERPIKHVFVVQGEEEPVLALVQVIRDHLGIEASAPMPGDVVEL
jgi:metallo-beta-lactamase family protein